MVAGSRVSSQGFALPGLLGTRAWGWAWTSEYQHVEGVGGCGVRAWGTGSGICLAQGSKEAALNVTVFFVRGKR